MASSHGTDWISRLFTNLILELTLLSALVTASDYCWYIHEDYGTVEQVYCKSGCCRDYGEEDEICCFEWSIGVIIGVAIAAITIISVVVLVVICCYSMKKRNRTGTVISAVPQHQTNTVVYTGASTFAYPHPPSGYYPSSQFPSAAPSFAPAYSSDPAYPPNAGDQSVPPPPVYTQAVGGTGNQYSGDMYGGYGKGAN